MDFVKIFNITLTEAKYKEPEALATSLNDTMEELNIDSLDCMLISSLLADVFGISEEKIDGMPMTSLTDLQTYINNHKTKDVESEEAVLAAVA